MKHVILFTQQMLQKLWSSWRLIEFSFYELLVANRSTLTDITGWYLMSCTFKYLPTNLPSKHRGLYAHFIMTVF